MQDKQGNDRFTTRSSPTHASWAAVRRRRRNERGGPDRGTGRVRPRETISTVAGPQAGKEDFDGDIPF